MKDLLKSLHSQLEHTLVEKLVMSYNPMLIIKEHFVESIGKTELTSGGGHRQELLSQPEREAVRDEIRNLSMFNDDDSRSKINFHVKIKGIWEGLSDHNVGVFINRNRERYYLKKI